MKNCSTSHYKNRNKTYYQVLTKQINMFLSIISCKSINYILNDTFKWTQPIKKKQFNPYHFTTLEAGPFKFCKNTHNKTCEN